MLSYLLVTIAVLYVSFPFVFCEDFPATSLVTIQQLPSFLRGPLIAYCSKGEEKNCFSSGIKVLKHVGSLENCDSTLSHLLGFSLCNHGGFDYSIASFIRALRLESKYSSIVWQDLVECIEHASQEKLQLNNQTTLNNLHKIFSGKVELLKASELNLAFRFFTNNPGAIIPDISLFLFWSIMKADEASYFHYMHVGYTHLSRQNTDRAVRSFQLANQLLLNRYPKSWLQSEAPPPYEFAVIPFLKHSRELQKTFLIEQPIDEAFGYHINPPSDTPLSNTRGTLSYFEEASVNVVMLSQVGFEQYGLFHTKDNQFLSYYIDFIAFYRWNPKNINQLPIVHIPELVFVGSISHIFFHWIVEAISRIVWLQSTGFFEQYPNAKIGIPAQKSYINDSLNFIGFPEANRVYFAENYISSYRVEKLFIPFLEPSQRCAIDTVCGVNHHKIPPRKGVVQANQLFNPNPLPLAKRHKIIYLQRTKGNRRVLYDDELIAEMKKNFGENLHVFGSPGELITCDNSRKLFREARIVIGPHGSGFSNLMFATPNRTVVIEFPVNYSSSRGVAFICSALGLVHWTIPEIYADYNGHFYKTDSSISTINHSIYAAAKWIENNWEDVKS